MTLPDSLILPHDPGMIDPEPIRSRFLALFGTGWQNLICEVLDMHYVTLSRQMNGHQPVDPSLVAHLEWLERTPVAKWPERWAKLAELHRAKVKKDAAS